MAKRISYKFLSAEINKGTEENPNIEPIFLEKSIPYTEIDEEIAKREAYNGEYTIIDDGAEEPVAQSLEERTAALEEALDLLLEGATE